MRRTWKVALLGASLVGISPSPARAQSIARVRTEENVRREPRGQVLARLEVGASVAVVRRSEPWFQVDVEGWVWGRSLEMTHREGLDLVVSADGGENLRDAPQGSVVGRLEKGMLLEERERRTGWIRVRRRAWMWAASLGEVASTPTVPAADEPPASAPATRLGFAAAGPGGAAILSAPGGDTVGRTVPKAELEVVAHQGSWARVRLEGWTWMPPGDSSAAGPDSATVTPADLRRDPSAYGGRVVVWQVQFISLERAEKVRTDFFEGEPFLLARYGGSDGPFVYVAVSPDRVEELKGLVPLELLSVTGRVRTGASSLTGTPIIDLVSLEH